MCFNKKVIAGLAVVLVGVAAFTPNLLGRALPLLVFAVCPLSMVFMMRRMDSQKSCDVPEDGRPQEATGGSQLPIAPALANGDEAQRRELEEEINRLRAEINLRDAGRA